MTKQALFQSIEQSQPLFAQGRKIASNATKGGGSGERAKAAGNLLLDLDHAQLPFGQVIVKGHRQVVQEIFHLCSPVLVLFFGEKVKSRKRWTLQVSYWQS